MELENGRVWSPFKRQGTVAWRKQGGVEYGVSQCRSQHLKDRQVVFLVVAEGKVSWNRKALFGSVYWWHTADAGKRTDTKVYWPALPNPLSSLILWLASEGCLDMIPVSQVKLLCIVNHSLEHMLTSEVKTSPGQKTGTRPKESQCGVAVRVLD